MQINLIWESSVSNDPESNLFKSDVSAAAQVLDSIILNPITVNIVVGYGTIEESSSFGTVYDPVPADDGEANFWTSNTLLTYAQLKNELIAQADSPADQTVVANLPASDPTNGGTFILSPAQAKAWGLLAANGSEIDGTVSFGVNVNPLDPYFLGVAEHELTHALGRSGFLGENNDYSLMDLFRYSSTASLTAPGALLPVGTPDPRGTHQDYFSIDGGHTALQQFDDSSDVFDWSGTFTAGDAFNATYSSLGAGTISTTDITELNVLGFTVADVGIGPIINGTVGGQAVADDSTITLFSGVTITDANANQTETVTVTLSAPANGTLTSLVGGTYNAGTGVYQVSGSTAAVTAALQGLVFDPTLGELAVDQTVTTDFTIAITDSADAQTSNNTTSVVTVASGSSGGRINLTTQTEASGSSFSGSGTMVVAGSTLNWSGTATVADTPSTDTWTGYSGTMAEEILAATSSRSSDIADTQFTNTALTSIGAPFSVDGMAVWGDPSANTSDTAATDSIGYSFSSPVPAGTPFMLWAPGGSFRNNFGPYAFTFSASLNGQPLTTANWSFAVQGPFGTSPQGVYTVAGNGEVLATIYTETNFPDAVIVVTPTTAVSSIEVTATTIPFDFWGLALPETAYPAEVPNDFYGTGTSALLWRNTLTGTTVMWDMNGKSPSSTTTLGGDLNWSVVGTGNFGGGTDDLLWRDSGGTVVMWEMNGSTQIASAALGGDSTWSVVGTGDFSGDGNTEILWQNVSGPLVMWFMHGTQTTGSAVIGADPNWHVVATTDMFGNGSDDILQRNAQTGQVAVWEMNGSQVVTSAIIGGDQTWSIVGAGDFSNDGHDDLLWRNAATGNVVMWEMNGLQQIGSALIGGDLNWSVVGTGNFSGSGDSDIIWQNTNGTAVMWHMDGTQVVSSAVIGGDPTWKTIAA